MFYFSDASSDPLLDEHFRRSLGADYESLFKKKTSTGGDSESSSPSSSTNSSINESTPPKVPDQLVVSTNISHQTQKQLNRSDTKTPTESANCSSNLQDNNKEDSTQVDDPVKAFQEDLEMEGYTGMSLFSSSIQLRIGGGDKSNSIELGGSDWCTLACKNRGSVISGFNRK